MSASVVPSLGANVGWGMSRFVDSYSETKDAPDSQFEDISLLCGFSEVSSYGWELRAFVRVSNPGIPSSPSRTCNVVPDTSSAVAG